MKNWFLVIFGGIISGTLSGIMPLTISEYSLGPGLYFGTLILVVLWSLSYGLGKYWERIFFIVLSVLAYLCAYYTTMFTGLFFIGGVIGAFILFLSMKSFFRFPRYPDLFVLVLAGGVLGVVGTSNSVVFPYYVLEFLNINYEENYISLFIIWQTGIIGLLYYFLKKANVKAKV